MDSKQRADVRAPRERRDRRSFLRQSALAAAAAAASSVWRLPALAATHTAGRSWRGAVIEAEERAKAGSPAYAYQLDWATPRGGGKFGAPHGSDIQLVFDNIAKPGATAEGPTAQPMADCMSETFIAFARGGDPNNKLIPRWERYTLPRRQTLIFDVPPHAEDDPRGAERRLFAKVPYVQPGT